MSRPGNIFEDTRYQVVKLAGLIFTSQGTGTDPLLGFGVAHWYFDGTTHWIVNADDTRVPLGAPAFAATTGGAITAGAPVRIHSDGKAYTVDNTEAQAAEFVGFAAAAAALGASLTILLVGPLLAGFTGLTPGVEYYEDNGAVVTWAAATVGHYVRRIGIALSATQIVGVLGEVQQR